MSQTARPWAMHQGQDKLCLARPRGCQRPAGFAAGLGAEPRAGFHAPTTDGHVPQGPPAPAPRRPCRAGGGQLLASPHSRRRVKHLGEAVFLKKCHFKINTVAGFSVALGPLRAGAGSVGSPGLRLPGQASPGRWLQRLGTRVATRSRRNRPLSCLRVALLPGEAGSAWGGRGGRGVPGPIPPWPVSHVPGALGGQGGGEAPPFPPCSLQARGRGPLSQAPPRGPRSEQPPPTPVFLLRQRGMFASWNKAPPPPSQASSSPGPTLASGGPMWGQLAAPCPQGGYT